MSNYYDPWAHGIQIFMQRVVQFLILSFLLGTGIWAVILHSVFEISWATIAKTTLVVFSTSLDLHWRVTFWQCVAIGVLVSGWLFSWLMGRAQLRRGDRHHRGTRVLDHEED